MRIGVDIDGVIADANGATNYDAPRAIPGAVSALHRLAQSHQIFYITSRPDILDTRLRTQGWLERNGCPVGQLVMNYKKAMTFREHKIDIYLDDNPDYVDDAIQAGVKGFLIHQGVIDGLPCTPTWTDFEKKVDELERERLIREG